MAACFAMFKQVLTDGADFSNDLNDVGRYYTEYGGLMEYWRSVLPGRVHFMQYERLVEDTETEIRRMLDYCGCRSRKAACASGKPTARYPRRAPNRCVAPSSAMPCINGVISSPGLVPSKRPYPNRHAPEIEKGLGRWPVLTGPCCVVQLQCWFSDCICATDLLAGRAARRDAGLIDPPMCPSHRRTAHGMSNAAAASVGYLPQLNFLAAAVSGESRRSESARVRCERRTLLSPSALLTPKEARL